jgi:hypothetical protein
MLVIGVSSNNGSYSHAELDVDIDDSPIHIHNLLSKKSGGKVFESILCVEDDTVVAEYEIDIDYDLTEKDDDEPDDNEDSNPDSLHEEETDE